MEEKQIDEVWKDIEGYEGSYQVSNIGNVKSLDRIVKRGSGYMQRKGKPIKPQPNSRGYMRVLLSNCVKDEHVFVHRLVAKHFLPNPQNKPHINHLDCNPKNNSLDNLEWVTHLENMHYAISLGRTIRTKKWLKNQRKSLIKYDCPVVGTNIKTGETVRFCSIQEAGRNGFEASSICWCCKGKRQTHKGYTWSYSKESGAA